MDATQLRAALEQLGANVPLDTQIVLIGGCALALLGSPRTTIDLDFIGDDTRPEPTTRLILDAALSLDMLVDAVPLGKFIPLPEGHTTRQISVGQFGRLAVRVADPYSIALSKLDRGLDSDMEDIRFLIQHEHITLSQLAEYCETLLEQAREFDISRADVLARLEYLRKTI